jgi:hypothetical protein
MENELEHCPVCGEIFTGVCSNCGYTMFADQRGAGVLHKDGTITPARECEAGVCVGKVEGEKPGRTTTHFCKFLEAVQVPGGIGKVIIHCKPTYTGEKEQ